MKKEFDNVEPRGIPKEIQDAVENRSTTELVFILDKSGSMAGMEKDTVGGFNAMIEKQKALDEKVYVSTILFSNYSEVLHDRKSLEEIDPLTENDYQVGGGTALLDAIGRAIKHIGNIHKYARKEDVPTRTLFVITTDGMENASRKYTYDRVRRMIEREKEQYGWEFLFLGANIDAAAEAKRFGIAPTHAANYHCDEEGTALNYEVLSDVVCSVRMGKSVDSGWKARIDEDYRKRG